MLEEGETSAGDEIVKVSEGPERVTVSGIDALLYLPRHPHDQLERALRIPALSPGWKGSLQALIDQEVGGTPRTGNRGLTAAAGPPPAWPGFRSMRVARLDRESASVTSLWLEAADGSSLPAAAPGQFLVLRIQPAPDKPRILRNYSLSGAPDAGVYRVSIKQEQNGVASTFLCNKVRVGEILETSAPRGSFTLQPAEGPVVLLSAGVGATPVMAMLHALVSTNSRREVWWLYGARNLRDHPFAEESRGLLEGLAGSRAYIVYSRPGPEDKLGQDYDAVGHLDVTVMDKIGVPRNADFYLCGPPPFLGSLTTGLKTWGVASSRVHQEIFGPSESVTPGIAGAPTRMPHLPAETPGVGPRISFVRSGLVVPWDPAFQSLLELAEACDVSVKWSCRTGVCHTCECALISGAVTYLPEPLEDPADGNILICCSQPRGDTEIDL